MDYSLVWNYPYKKNYDNVSATVIVNGTGVDRTVVRYGTAASRHLRVLTHITLRSHGILRNLHCDPIPIHVSCCIP